MATETYVVKKPVLHSKIILNPGATLALADKDAEQLLKDGTIVLAKDAPASVAAAAYVAPIFSGSSLAKLSVADLQKYAEAHRIELNPAWTKDEIVAALAVAAPPAPVQE